MLRRSRYQRGSVQLRKNRSGDHVWVYRYFETGSDGRRVRRGVSIGTIQQYPTQSAAEKAAGHLRIQANDREHVRQEVKTLSHAIDRFIAEEMPRRKSSQRGYLIWFERFIRPTWGDHPIASIRPLEVRAWLRKLSNEHGKPLAPRSLGHIHGLMRQLYQWAMLWEWMPLTQNPLSMFRLEGSTKRRKQPTILTFDQFNEVLYIVEHPAYRSMILCATFLGARMSEFIALKWQDILWDKNEIHIQRGMVRGNVDDTKTDGSNTVLPMAPMLETALKHWRTVTRFASDADWVFASPYFYGRKPYSANFVYAEHLVPAGKRIGVQLSWHSFRHTYRAWLDEVGTPMGIMQKLMRHADIRTTMNVYGGAMPESLRTANSKVVEIALRERKTG